MDQYHGQGGSYILDPKTGERVPFDHAAASGPEFAAAPERPRRRARTERGRFRGDDPATTDVDEAWQ